MVRLNKILDRFFSTSAAGLYIILFAIAIAAATFIENDFGTAAAQKVVFRTRWFEGLLILFGICLVANIIRFKMVRQKKWAVLIFHAAMIVILLGAGVTRYFGSEGMMHIREGSETNLILSNETYLQFEIKQDGQVYKFDEPVFFASLGRNRFRESYQIGDQVVDFSLEDFIPNPVEKISSNSDGAAVLKVVVAGADGRQEFLVKEHEQIGIEGTLFNFKDKKEPGAVNISLDGEALLFETDIPVVQMEMATQRLDTLQPSITHPIRLRSLYRVGALNYVFSDFQPNAATTVVSSSRKMGGGSIAMARLLVTVGDHQAWLDLEGNKGMVGHPKSALLGQTSVTAAYGSKYLSLPFSIRLRDFIMERYPGTNSASSYASEVTLIDQPNGVVRDQRIFMNNILNYGGYRFFQSSFDKDELGTILSVNHDSLGTWISYFGYFLLTIGMVLTLLSKKSRFHSLSQQLKGMRTVRKIATTLIPFSLVMLDSLPSKAVDNTMDPQFIIDKEHAAAFGRLAVQDFRGRMKPINTMASEVLRKLSRNDALYHQNADQIFLGMMAYPDYWSEVPLIKLGKHERLTQLVAVSDKLARYSDFFNPDYILKDHVRKAYNMEPRYRGTFEKEIIKIDERVNICNMVFNGRLSRIFPQENSEQTQWLSPADVHQAQGRMTLPDFVRGFYPSYINAIKEANERNDWQLPSELLDQLCHYQTAHGGDIMPSDRQIQYEILLNKLNVFSRVGKYYALSGLLILIMFFVKVFNAQVNLQLPLKIALGILGLLFLFHTIGLGLRWYVSGRAPWSNGYESMIYIGWTTMLAGMLFTRKSLGGLAATSILASTILMVAGLSWMDPEITPLVPVLKSYWLTIHVSLEAGSYGFLMLGAIIGVLNLILMIFVNRNNNQRIQRTIKELTYISEMTLIGGLFMISIGTYLGGVWANESWGRYWGWDAKETWALVTILVYAFILHMRFIPGFRSLYAFNVASLFGLASVMMTYFGVNYYLSGLHSYAAGDPAPIPSFVYYSVGILLAICLLALWRKNQQGIRL